MTRGAKRAAESDDGAIDGPWELPKGWRWERLGSVLPLEYGKALPARTRDGTGAIPVYGSSGVVGCHDQSLAAGPSILVGRKGSAGAVHFAAGPFWPIDTAYYVRPAAGIDLRFGFRLLQHLRLDHLDQSTAIPSLSRDIYSGIAAPIPPIAVQRRIVARIEALFAEIDEGDRALAAARRGVETYRKSLMNAAFAGELTAHWRCSPSASVKAHELLRTPMQCAARTTSDRVEQYVEAEGPEDSSDGLPPTWIWTSLGQFFSICVGATPSRSDPSLWNGPVPWVSSGEVAFCRIRSTREQIAETAVKPDRIHPPGTVLLGMIGEGKTRGQVAILDIPAAHNQNCASIRVSETSVPPEYVYWWLEHQYEVTRADGAGGNQPALNKARVAAIRLPLPPSEEMVEIVERLAAALDAAKDAAGVLADAGDNSAALRQSILAAAFRGELDGGS